MNIRRCRLIVLSMALIVGGATLLTRRISASDDHNALDDQLSLVLSQHGFTGTVGSSIEQRLGRRIDNQLATSAVICSTIRLSASTMTTPALAVTPRQQGSATRNRLQSASTTTSLLARIAADRETSGAHQWLPTMLSSHR